MKTTEQLILENQNLIYSITKYFEKYSNKEDLFQAGCIGMILAYKNYDPSMNVKFTTYAYPYILGEMKKLVREDRSMKVGRRLQMLYLKIEKARVLLTQKWMRFPTNQEIADYLEIPLSMMEEAIGSSQMVYSLDEPLVDQGKEINLYDTIGQVESMDIDNLILLRQELGNLEEFERELITKRYLADKTQQETSRELGITQVQVSRREQKILTKLRDKLVS